MLGSLPRVNPDFEVFSMKFDRFFKEANPTESQMKLKENFKDYAWRLHNNGEDVPKVMPRTTINPEASAPQYETTPPQDTQPVMTTEPPMDAPPVLREPMMDNPSEPLTEPIDTELGKMFSQPYTEGGKVEIKNRTEQYAVDQLGKESSKYPSAEEFIKNMTPKKFGDMLGHDTITLDFGRRIGKIIGAAKDSGTDAQTKAFYGVSKSDAIKQLTDIFNNSKLSPKEGKR